jgi:hypothetical protein
MRENNPPKKKKFYLAEGKPLGKPLARGKALRKPFRLPKAEACNNTRLAKFVADQAAKIQGRKNQSARETGQLLGARGLMDGVICRDSDKV